MKRLFRKVDNISSQYDKDHPGTVRRDGSYIIEEFLPTGGTDVKVGGEGGGGMEVLPTGWTDVKVGGRKRAGGINGPQAPFGPSGPFI